MCHELGGVGRLFISNPFVRSLIIMKDAEPGRKAQKLPMAQAELLTPWVSIVEVMINQKRFVDQHSTRFQCMNELWKDWSSQIKEDDDGIVSIPSKVRRWRMW